MKERLACTVNGQEQELLVEPRRTLLELLRGELGLTGTKLGCDVGECGACTVLLDGAPVRACLTLALEVEGQKITTIEGLADGSRLHPLQQAFLEHGGVQCGFCTPGMILAAKALLDQRPAPSEAEIREGLSGNLCRCTGYVKIVEAVQAAASTVRGEALPSSPSTGQPGDGARVVGTSAVRVDGPDKATGRALYVDDIVLPKMLHGKILRSPYPHARIRAIDVSKARRVKGVRVVLTAEDLPDGRMGPFILDEPVLARGKVRCIGEPVAAVAAVDPDVAQEALDLIEVEYEELPALLDPIEAMQEGAPLIHEEYASYAKVFQPVWSGNVCSHTTFEEGDLEQGLREADVVLEDTFRTQMVHQGYLEPCGAVAAVDAAGKVTIWTTTQSVFITQARIAEALHLPMTKIRVIGTKVGGGFGGKVEPTVQPIALALCREAGAPVKIVMTRDEDFIAMRPRHPAIASMKIGATKDGRIVAKQARIVYDTGAYADDGPGIAGFGAMMARGPYRIPHVKIEGICVYTNKVKCGAFRGFGNPQSTFASESLMDEVARRLGIDPVEFRLKNGVEHGDRALGGQPYGSVGYKECLKRAAAAIGWDRPKAGKLRGRGVASINHISGLLPSSAFVKLNEDGTAVLMTGVSDIGQGSDTVLSQIAAETLGLPLEDVATA
ncbi:MAG: molybdopterin-dependent oxidoreductase, partial [Deltaproteobacteria bacterium]|nr:molybdopterin-dependent oxidoreductase [Deltaproteobacteria bacterium]